MGVQGNQITRVLMDAGELLSKDQYVALLHQSGLVVDQWIDKTNEWCDFVWLRCEQFITDNSEPASHNKVFVDEMTHFYRQIVKLYHGTGRLRASHPKVQQMLHEEQWEISANTQQNLGGVWIYGHKRNYNE
jgi:hypothetical protein